MKPELEWLRDLDDELTLWWRSAENTETFKLIDELHLKVRSRMETLTKDEEE